MHLAGSEAVGLQTHPPVSPFHMTLLLYKVAVLWIALSSAAHLGLGAFGELTSAVSPDNTKVQDHSRVRRWGWGWGWGWGGGTRQQSRESKREREKGRRQLIQPHLHPPVSQRPGFDFSTVKNVGSKMNIHWSEVSLWTVTDTGFID